KPPTTTDCLLSGLTTLTSAGPTGKAGVITVTSVAVGVPEMVASTPPNDTWSPLRKPVPVICTTAPPAAAPLEGLMPVMTGAGLPTGGVGPVFETKNPPGNTDCWPSGLTTLTS